MTIVSQQKIIINEALPVANQNHDKRNVASSLLRLAQFYVDSKTYEVATKLFGGFEMLLPDINCIDVPDNTWRIS